jgi:hypothetical protein
MSSSCEHTDFDSLNTLTAPGSVSVLFVVDICSRYTN